jgi:hypothetical protein
MYVCETGMNMQERNTSLFKILCFDIDVVALLVQMLSLHALVRFYKNLIYNIVLLSPILKCFFILNISHSQIVVSGK